MAHVHDDEWVDFVRGTLAADRAAAITAHLGRGCARCLRARDLWFAVVETARREQPYTPPAAAVRIARSRFVPARGERTLAPLLAGLIFDSLREARAAGVRGIGGIPRHILYQAGPLSVDLRLEPSPGSTRLVLVGQVADAERPAPGVGRCRVALLAGDRKLHATSTNRLGEFQLKFAPQENLALLVTVQNRRSVLVPFEGVSGGGPGRH